MSLILVHLPDGGRRPVDPAAIYFAAAAGHQTELRFAERDPWIDVRPLAGIEALLAPHGFLRLHREHLVHPARIYEIRKRGDGSRDWEIQLEPPVNLVLPVARAKVADLWAAFGE